MCSPGVIMLLVSSRVPDAAVVAVATSTGPEPASVPAAAAPLAGPSAETGLAARAVKSLPASSLPSLLLSALLSSLLDLRVS